VEFRVKGAGFRSCSLFLGIEVQLKMSKKNEKPIKSRKPEKK
jgi:hypothetical protein